MEKILLKQEKSQRTVDDLENGDIVGFVTTGRIKGFVVHIGSKFSAVSMQSSATKGNVSFGSAYGNSCESVREALDLEKRCSSEISEVYVFKTLTALHEWLSRPVSIANLTLEDVTLPYFRCFNPII